MQEINTRNISLPEYDNPPVTEVVCGVTFDRLEGLFAAHIGILWGLFQPDFPMVNEVAPLASVVEIFDEQLLDVQMGITDVPPLPREMFISRDENNIIQVQRDRFIFNWRKLRQEDSYPRYVNVVQSFHNRFEVFRNFIETANMVIMPRQYELSYINQIPQGDLWEKVSDLGTIFPNIHLAFDGRLVLTEPETAYWRTSFVLPNKLGRLYATVRTDAVRNDDKKPIIVFDLTVRGMANSDSLSDMHEWFDTARQWIVKGFTDLTSKDVQEKVWKRSV